MGLCCMFYYSNAGAGEHSPVLNPLYVEYIEGARFYLVCLLVYYPNFVFNSLQSINIWHLHGRLCVCHG